MYETTTTFFWKHIADHIHTIEKDGCSCAQNGFQLIHKRNLYLFPGTGLLEFLAIDIFGHLPKTTSDNKGMAIMINRYCERTRANITGILL